MRERWNCWVRETLLKAPERWASILSVPQPAVGFLGGIRGVAWGLWLCCHAGLFAKYSFFFAPMARIGPPWVWGSAVAALGTAQLLSQGLGYRRGRRICAMAACIGWSGLCFLYWQGDPSSLGIPLLACDAAAAGWSFLRLGDSHGRPDDGGTP